MVYRHWNFTEFPPQAEFRLATEGWQLTNQVVEAPPTLPPVYDLSKVSPTDYAITPKPVRVMVPALYNTPESFRVGETDNYARYEWRLAQPRRHAVQHADGVLSVDDGVIAHRASMLASFKNGKSKEIGMWATGFACLPGATIDMVGLEYGTSEHEFDYLCEALLSGSKPLIKKYKHYYNDVRAGRMYLELLNGCSFGVRSYKNKDALRGGQITCYIFNEIYQLPGLEVYTGHAQNLRAERGFAAFTSTPDRPWVKVLHTLGHGKNPDWHCVCDNNAYVNPFTFDITSLMADLPDWETLAEHAPGLLMMAQQTGIEPGRLMSREKFKISWLGQMGGFVGRVYSFARGNVICTPGSHPHVWKPKVAEEWASQEALLVQARAH